MLDQLTMIDSDSLEAITQALDKTEDNPIYEYTVMNGVERTVEKKELTREDAMELLSNNMHLSHAAIFDYYGSEVNGE